MTHVEAPHLVGELVELLLALEADIVRQEHRAVHVLAASADTTATTVTEAATIRILSL